jgi:hypothetical protein
MEVYMELLQEWLRWAYDLPLHMHGFWVIPTFFMIDKLLDYHTKSVAVENQLRQAALYQRILDEVRFATNKVTIPQLTHDLHSMPFSFRRCFVVINFIVKRYFFLFNLPLHEEILREIGRLIYAGQVEEEAVEGIPDWLERQRWNRELDAIR